MCKYQQDTVLVKPKQSRIKQLLLQIKPLYLPFIIGIFSAFVYNQFIFDNISISEPRGYYLALPYAKLDHNQLVLVCITNLAYDRILINLGIPSQKHQCNGNLPYLIKKIVAIPDDKVTITPQGVLVNGKLIPNSKGLKYWNNLNLHPLRIGYSHRLTQNQYFLIGTTSHSFDSRYFGIVEKKDIYRTAYHL